ncbi:MAG: sugar ABC transporter ATP-binding protein [Aggregatilineales bacterium]
MTLPPPVSPLLTISDASKSYNGVPALISAQLTLYGGEVHALMGENGAGKSTLIKMLAGVLTPDRMQITLRGQLVTIQSAQAAFDLGLRFIHQELNVVPQLSVAENIFLNQPYPRWGGVFVHWRNLNAAAQTVLRQLGIEHLHSRTLTARLSPGDQMLLKIASAFVGADTRPAAVYVMDEPTAALSGAETALLFTVIKRLRARGCAVLYVSHRMDEIFRIADRVTVMRDGQVIATQPVSNTSPPELIQLMTGRALQHVYPPRDAPHHDAPLLEVRDLSTRAVYGISFTLHVGEILGVAGLSDAHCTELLRALMGVDRAHAGSVSLSGERLRGHSPSAAWQHGLAYVPQERRTQGLVISRAVTDNITLPHLGVFSFGGVALDARRGRHVSQTIGAAVRLRASSHRQTVRELSGGNQQKVVFARALARSPRVLLLDEPTRGVDIGAKYDLYNLIRQRSAQGVGIILTSSDLPELIGLCDRLLIMQHGRLIDTISAAGLTEAALLTRCYPEPVRKTGDER